VVSARPAAAALSNAPRARGSNPSSVPSTSRKDSLRGRAEAIRASSITAAVGHVTRYSQGGFDGAGPAPTSSDRSRSWLGWVLTAPRQLTTIGHAPNSLTPEISRRANAPNEYKAGHNCALA